VQSVITSDGVELGLVESGPEPGSTQAPNGLPPLVLVHGGATTHQCFDAIVPALAERRRVVAYDRRGRGLSGDGTEPYRVRREVQDLVEVAAAVGGGEPVDVFGYSYGGMLALLALASGHAQSFRRVAVYEPPFDVPGMPAEGMDEQMVALVEEGRVEEGLRNFVTQTFFLPDEVVDLMEQHPGWQVSVAAASTLRREHEIISSTPPPRSLPEGVPVRVLVGEEGGNPAFRDIASRLPVDDVVYVGGLPHFAIPTDTYNVVKALSDFFDG
jgi:pimeloyl-ACP methyl ester carboxylesterase